jgi:hypothetical protein
MRKIWLIPWSSLPRKYKLCGSKLEDSSSTLAGASVKTAVTAGEVTAAAEVA